MGTRYDLRTLLSHLHARRSGGIGRRASLRGWCPQGRGGSSPPSDTIKTRVLHPGQGDDAVRQTADTSCVASKTERLGIRLTPEQDAVLRRAAEARGES